MNKFLKTTLAVTVIFTFILSCIKNTTEELQPNSKNPDENLFTFTTEKKHLSRFASLLNYTKFSNAKLLNNQEISFVAEKLDNEKINYQITKLTDKIIVKQSIQSSEINNNFVEYNKSNNTVTINYKNEKLTFEKGFDTNKLSEEQYEFYLNASIMVLEATSFELNEKTIALSKNRPKQMCGGVGVGGAKSLAASRSMGIADQCSCGGSLGTDCGCAWGDFICICITWRECDCAGGHCGDVQ